MRFSTKLSWLSVLVVAVWLLQCTITSEAWVSSPRNVGTAANRWPSVNAHGWQASKEAATADPTRSPIGTGFKRKHSRSRPFEMPPSYSTNDSDEAENDSKKEETTQAAFAANTTTTMAGPEMGTANELSATLSLSSAELETALDDESDLGLFPEQKLLNLVLLSAAFGYAVYTILSIDAGMTRGWSAAEIALRIPLDNWGAYESYLEHKPIVTKTLINVIIYLLGDWLSQTAFQKKNLLEFDVMRTLRNGFIGMCFGPLVHAYYEFSDAILPPELGMVTRLQKILMDQTLYLTIKCSVYISAVGLLAGEDWESVQKTVRDKLGGIVVTAWKFWPIVHCVTYSVIPAQHRILWVNSVDLVWNAILSGSAQNDPTKVPDQAEVLDQSQACEFDSRDVVVRSEDDSDRSASTNTTSTPLLVPT